MTRLAPLLLLLMLAPACTGLQVLVAVHRDGRSSLLAENAGLTAGDRFALRVSATSDSYVYLARTLPDGGTLNLYPLDRPLQVRAGQPQWVPTRDNPLALDALQPGDRICLVLSRTPISGELPRCPAASMISSGDRRNDGPRGSDGQGGTGSNGSSDGQKGGGSSGSSSSGSSSSGGSSDDKPAHLGKDQRPAADGVTVLPLPLASCIPVPSGNKPARRALLIGIDHYLPPRRGSARAGELRGALNDVEAMRTVIRARYGFTEREICVLRDGEATRAGIQAAIRSFLIAPARPGDQAFFYYAGHGSTAPNPLSQEPDRLDETVVPADANLQVADLRDKEFARLFNEVLDRGSQLVAIFDSCHSGSVTMSTASAGLGGSSDGTAALIRYAEPAIVLSPPLLTLERPPQARGAVILTATQSHQSAQERPIGGVQHGLFTAALLRALLSQPIQQPIGSILQSAQGYMRNWAHGAPQVPGLEANETRRQQPLFGGALREGIYVAVARRTNQGVLLQAGHGLGLGPGAELERSTSPTVKLRVHQVIDITNSLATVVTGDPAALRPGDLLRLRSFGRPEHSAVRLWLGEAGPATAELAQVAAALAPLANHPAVHWVTDPHADPPSHVVRYQNGIWVLSSAGAAGGSGDQPLGAQISAPALLNVLPASAKLLVIWPLDVAQHQELSTALRRLGLLTLTPGAEGADYVLAGVAETAGARPRFAFLMPAAPAQPGSMPSKLAWVDPSKLAAQAVGLQRQKLWLELPSPPEPADAALSFPYTMQLVEAKSQRVLHAGDRTEDNEHYFLRLQAPAALAPQPVESRYVYLCVMNNQGEMGLLYPPHGGNQQNYLPATPLFQRTIDLSPDSVFRTGGTPSIETYLLLTSTQPLPNPAQACSIRQSLNTCPSVGTPGAELCHLLQGLDVPAESAPAPKPARWSIQRLVVHHKM